ncbi:MAG: MarR family winged helix-turn-helix transcriptional regulator [Kiloniellaceae bacterium]
MRQDRNIPPGHREESLAAQFAVDVLPENHAGALWHICLTANSFVFPIYAEFERDHGITRMEFVVMFVLSHRPRATATDIIRMTALPKNNISRGVNRLLQKGLIRSLDDREDGRRRILELSPKGRRLMEILLPQYSQRARGFLDRLDDTDRRDLSRIILKLAGAIAV